MIRKAKPHEIDKLLAITAACAEHMISNNIHQWNALYPSREAFENDIERGELYVMESQEELLGCITISSFKDAEYDDIDWLTDDGKNFYIHRLAVHPRYQGQGLARSLMDFAEALAQSEQVVSIRLDTFSQNKRNQQFYEARGYQRLGDIFFPKQSTFPFHCYELVLAHQ